VGVTHRIRRDVMLYPGYEPYLGRAPMIMHYGSDFKLGKAYFNKMSHTGLQLEQCRGFLFEDPEEPIEDMSKRDGLAMEHLLTLNSAFCGFYKKIGCKNIPSRCDAFAAQYKAVQPILTRCVNDHEGCDGWAQAGECVKNPKFMHAHCAVACQSCGRPIDDLDPAEQHYGDWKYLEQKRYEEKSKLLTYITTASEEELDELEASIAERKDELNQKHEL